MYTNIYTSTLVIFPFFFPCAFRPPPSFVPGVDGNKKKNLFPSFLPLFGELMRRPSRATQGTRRSGSTCSDTPCFSDFFFFSFPCSFRLSPFFFFSPGVDEKTFMRYAGHEKIWEHLQRHALADLFLDINEYNGGTTGLDAYWADVPILSTPVEKFSGFF